MRRIVDFCWSLFKWGFALAIACALCAAAYLYFRLDEEIRCFAEQTLSGHYKQLQVEVGSARFVPGRGVTVFDIKFSQPAAGGIAPAVQLLHIDELSLVGRFEVKQLATGSSAVDRVIVRRPKLLAHRGMEGRWSFEPMLPLPKFGNDSPPLEIQSATLTLSDASRPESAPFVLHNIDVAVTREAIASSPEGPKQLNFTGQIKESLAKTIGFSGSANLESGQMALTADIDSLKLNSDLLQRVPNLPEAVSRIELAAIASARVEVNSPARGQPLEWSSSFRVQNGSMRHPKLPRPLSNVEASGQCSNTGLTLRSCKAKCGTASIALACNRNGWSADAPLAAQGHVTDLTVDGNLQKSLPPKLLKLCRRFKPTGMVNATGKVTFDGDRWIPDVMLDCREASAEDSEKFPYRMTAAKGTIRYFGKPNEPGNKVALNFAGLAEGKPVTVAAEFRGLPCPLQKNDLPPCPGCPPNMPRPPCPVGWVEVRGNELEVTESMLAALPAKARKIAYSLRPKGKFAMRWRMERPNAQVWKPDVEIDLDPLGCAIRYEKFPYALSNIRGRIRSRNGVWNVEQLESRQTNGPRVVKAYGSLRPIAGRPVLELNIQAQAARLDENLRQAMPPHIQEVWNQLQPEGRVSFSSVVNYQAGDPKPNIYLDVIPYERSVSIHPRFFQYRLNRMDGRFVFSEGQVQFKDARAEHGRTQMMADGSWTPLQQGGWRFEMTGLHVDYLDADRDLRLAAPIAVRRVIDTLQPEGNFSVHNSRLAFTRSADANAPLRTDWDVRLDCHQTDVNWGVRVKGVSGTIHMTGVNHGEDCRTVGHAQLDTMFWNGLQLTNVRGPLWASKDECRIGRGVADKHPEMPSTEMTADAYGGKVGLNARVLHGERTQYFMAINFGGVDLDRFGRDFLHSQAIKGGQAKGTLNLNGTGSSVYGLEGNGVVDVSGSNLGELPVMVSLLKVLRSRVPDTNAFDGCHAEFKLRGRHVQFDHLDLLGDAISLYGRGEASLDKKINLVFHSIVGRGAPAVPLLKTLVGQASEQLLRLRVGGTIDAPDIRRETLPVVGNVLEQLRADFQPKPLSKPPEVPTAAARRRQSSERY